MSRLRRVRSFCYFTVHFYETYLFYHGRRSTFKRWREPLKLAWYHAQQCH